MKETILLYNFKEKYREKQITALLAAMKFEVKTVPEKGYNMPIGYQAGAPGVMPFGGEYEGEELPDEMLVMAGLTREQVDQVLAGFRKSGLKRVEYKAVLTQTNQYWNAFQLFDELKREHEAFQQNS